MWSDMSVEIASGICEAIGRIKKYAPEVKKVLDPRMASSAT
jgi:hypothetical protein